MGSVVGGYLAAAGNSVTLIDINDDFVTAINSRGLILESEGAQRVIDIRAAKNSTNLQPVDLIVVLVKSFHTEEAMKGCLNLLGPRTTVLSLQNGLGHEEVLVRIVGKERVIAGIIESGSINPISLMEERICLNLRVVITPSGTFLLGIKCSMVTN